MTGLADRTLFERRVEEKLSGRRRRGGSTAVIFLDLDGFKDITQEHGRAVGDEVLGQVATRLVACARTEDTVARMGEDEFAIVLDETGAPGAAAVAQRILRALEAPIVVSGRSVVVGTSIGIAVVHGGSSLSVHPTRDAHATTLGGEHGVRDPQPPDRS